MKTSESINELAAALAAAQGQFTNPTRDRAVHVNMKAGGSYDFKYATLAEIRNVIRKPLAENGLCIMHGLAVDEGGTICVTRLQHASGQWVEIWMPVLVAEGANAQGWKSAVTYARRGNVVSLLDLADDDDDDGNAACGNEAAPVARQTRPAQKPPAKRSTVINDIDAPDVKAALDYAVNAPDWEHCGSGIDRVLGKPWTQTIKDVVITAFWERRLRLVKEATVETFRNGLPELISSIPIGHAYKQMIDEAAAARMAELDAVSP